VSRVGDKREKSICKNFDELSKRSTNIWFYRTCLLRSLIRRVLSTGQKRFIAQWRVTAKKAEDPSGLVRRERAAVQELWRAGIVVQHWIAPDQISGWLIVRAESFAAANAILTELPRYRYLDFSVSEVVKAI
jgi:muconolactone delta-isomerase